MTGRLAPALLLAAVLALAVPGRLEAQSPAAPQAGHDFTSCAIVGVLTGVSTASSEAGAMAGGMVGWPLTPRTGLEVEAAWSDRRHDGSAFAASMTVRRNFTPRQTVVPFVKMGAGVNVARFDVTRAAPPDFYGRRLESGGSLPRARHTFTDPALVIAGGISWFVGARFAIRPEVQTMLLVADGRVAPVVSVAARIEYHFEEYRVTANRTGR